MIGKGSERSALLLVLLACAGCATVEPAELVGGWEGTLNRGYAFAAPAFRTALDEDVTLLVKPAASYLYYDIPADDGPTEVSSPGASLGLAVRYATPRVATTLGTGYEVRDTERQFPDGRREHETEKGLATQADGFYQATPKVNLSTIAAYSWANDYVWVRLGAKRQLSNFDYAGPSTLHVGLEATVQGNDDVESGALGLVFEVAGRRSSLQLRTGFLHATSDGGPSEDELYVGLGFYRGF